MANEPGTDKTAASADATVVPAPPGAGAPSQGRSSAADSGLAEPRKCERPTGPASAEEPGGLTEREKFQITCLRNALYHEDREQYYARLHRIAMFVVVAAGAASLTSFMQASVIGPVVVTFAGLVDLVFDVSGKARLHASLRRRIYGLLALAENESADIVHLREQAISSVYADEPPCMHAVNALAYNSAMAAFQRPKQFQFKISGWQRFWRNTWPYPSTDFKTYDELAKTASGQ